MSESAVGRVGLVLVGVGAVGMFYLLVSWLVTPVALAESGRSAGEFRVADFLYQISLTEAYWSGFIESPYLPEDQARVLAAYFDSGGGIAMAHGMSPVSLVLWYPLSLAARTHPAAVYSLWVSICFAVFALSLARVYGTVDSPHWDLRIFVLGALLAVAASRVGWRAFGVGQSAPVAAAGLLFLTMHLIAQDSSKDSGDHGNGVLLICYLLVLWKVHYIALAGGLHLMLGEPRRALAYATGASTVAIGIPSVFDPTLFSSYVDQLSHFAGRGFTSEYSQVGQATAGGSGVTLRTVLRNIAPERLADAMSWGVFGAAMLALVTVRLRWNRSESKEFVDYRQSLVHRGLALLFLAAALVLLPYLGRYDDLFLLVAVTLVVVGTSALRNRALAAATVLALGLTCLLPAPDLGGTAALVLFAKLGALLLLIWLAFARTSPSSEPVL